MGKNWQMAKVKENRVLKNYNNSEYKISFFELCNFELSLCFCVCSDTWRISWGKFSICDFTHRTNELELWNMAKMREVGA